MTRPAVVTYQESRLDAQRTPPDLALPTLERYQLLERIGGNAASVVYAACDTHTGAPVALKMIVADLEDERETRERFLREATVTASLAHPNIVRVLDVGDDRGRPFIAMERLTGCRLDEYLRRIPARALAETLALMIALCDGLQAAHDRDIVHRDIKPGNLFVTDGGILKILDFGLARLQASTLTASGQIVGTPDFMAPEQAEGHRADHRADIFSAAAVSYLMIAGHSPFARSNLRETLNALLNGTPAPFEAPDPLKRVLLKGMARRPDDRYQSAAAMRHDLAQMQQTAQSSSVWRRLAGFVGVLPL